MINRITRFFILILIFLSVQCFAQNKTFTLEDAFSKRLFTPKSIKQLQWIPGSDYFSYVDKKILIRGNVENEKRDSLLKLDDINSALTKIKDSALSAFPQITWTDENTFYFDANYKLYNYALKEKTIQPVNSINEKAENIDISGKTLNVAYTIKNNLLVAVKGKEIAVTTDTNKNIVNGKSVHREEFGIEKGTFWSPKGNLLAFYRMDQTMVTDYPLVHIDNVKNRIAEEEDMKYPMAGMKSHHVTVGVFDPFTQKKIFLKTGEPADQYLTNITWSPDEKFIYIQVLNREQNLMKLNQYDASSGDFVKTLFEEQNRDYVEPLHPLYFLKTKPDEFIYQSQKDGYNHLYLYDTSGKLIKQLTKGNWVVTELLGTDNNDSKAFYISTAVSPLEKHIYLVNLSNGKISQISTVKGTHYAQVSDNGKYVLDNYSSTSITKEYAIESSEGKLLQTLLKNYDPMKDYKMPTMTIFNIKAKDSSDLYCRLIKPYDFNPSKKYPVIVYVYGGPHSQMVTDSWLGGANIFLHYLANKGYVIFTLDNHGSENRGLAFEQAIFRNLGKIELEDQMLGIDYLKKLPYIDTSRIGVHGWSYGGFLTVSLMLKHADVFKVAVAGGPVIDWKFYEVMYGERYMRTPEENPFGYYNADLLNFAKNLKGKLLIIHGTNDHTVVWQNSLAFIRKCIDEGVQCDYFVYPEQDHNMTGKDRLHLNRKIENYFNDYLKP